MQKKILIVTGTRADWGILAPLARALKGADGVSVTVAATNMHLSPAYGNTLQEIRNDSFEPVIFEMEPEVDSRAGRVHSMAQCLDSAAHWLATHKCDLLVVLGDRFEMLAVATAAMMSGVPICHVSGGDTTLGAVDDAIRTSISAMAAVSLATTCEAARKLKRQGIGGEVYVTGSTALERMLDEESVSIEELDKFLGMHVDCDTVLVTYHPATLDPVPVKERVKALTDALDAIPGLKAVITAPNNDAGGQEVRLLMEEYCRTRPADRVFVASLGARRYMSLMRQVGAVVGNSSSGIIEAPSAHVPTVDIGIRQKGRVAAKSVIHCDDDTASIMAAIRQALTPESLAAAARVKNPYYRRDATRLSVAKMLSFLSQ